MNYSNTETGLSPMPVIRMEKSSLRTIIGKILTYQAPAQKQVIRSNFCSSCPEGIRHEKIKEYCHALTEKDCPDIQKIRTAKAELDAIDHMCITSSCSKCQIKTIYRNDKKNYRLYTSPDNTRNQRIPRTAIRLFLLLYALPQSLLGTTHFIRNLSAVKAAEYLSCTVSTVKRCMKILEGSGYITFSHALDLSHFNIILNHYDTMHLPAEKGGSGYLSFDRNTLDALLAIKNVNHLRLEILFLLQYDNAQYPLPKEALPVWENYSFRDLKNMLPAHMNYRARFEQILDNPNTLFHHYISDRRIYFSLKNDFSLRFDYDTLISANYICLQEYFSEHHFSLKENELISLSEMTTQFDLSLILHCTCQVLNRHKADTAIRNLPGLVRRCCLMLATGNSAAV